MRTTTLYAGAAAALLSGVEAQNKESRTFAVLRFNGNGPLMEGRVDPIVMGNTNSPSAHVHTVMGASNFGFQTTGQSLQQSTCTNAMIEGDMSAYWFPKMYFHDKAANTFEPVDMFYSNVYYFFDKTQDKIKAFPLGLNMVAGNASTRVAPAGKGDTKLTSPGAQPASFTCPRSQGNQAQPAWPADSDGSKAGFQSANNKGEGTGFPFAKCDGFASPLRADVHFPSCYNPQAGLTAHKTNMVYPSDVNGYWNCPAGYVHVPHLFLEVYWNTPLFDGRWNQQSGEQPFVLSSGDRTGFGLHADFISGWNEEVLQHIIDTCDAGTSGMDKCPGVKRYPPETKCNIQSPVNEVISGVLSALPGNNPLAGWGVGNVNTPPASNPPASNPPATNPSTPELPANPPPVSSSSPAPTSSTAPAPGSGSGGNGGAQNPAPPVPTSPPEQSQEETGEPSPSPSVTSKVITTTDAKGNVATVTVWETVTAWVTKTVYDDGTPAAPTPTGSSGALVGGFQAVGCFKDSASRAIVGDKYPALGPMTNEKCIAHCSKKNFSVAGTQNGGQCFCGNAVTPAEKLADSSCSTKCEGDASETCGGSWALSVFSKDGTTSPGGAAKARRHLEHHVHHARNKMAYSPRRRR